jgi:flagellum-specific ATP synthase
MMAVYARSEDLVRIGAYKSGSDPELDRALHARSSIRAFLMQDTSDQPRLADTLARLAALAAEV